MSPASPQSKSDEQLLVAAGSGDIEAFELLYDRQITAAYALAYRIVGNKQAADDVCQEAFLAVWRSAAKYDSEKASAKTWILTVIRNRSIDNIRSASRLRDHAGEPGEILDSIAEPENSGTEAKVLEQDSANQAKALLGFLTRDQRRVVELSFYSGYTHSEIAHLLDIPLGTVKARINRGLAKMKSHMEPEGVA